MKTKKVITLALSAALVLSLAACTQTPSQTGAEGSDPLIGSDPATWGPSPTEEVQIPNPFSDCNSLEDAAAITGFHMVVPDAVNGYPNRQIQVMDDTMIQVILSSDDGETIFIRKAAGSGDISGDYRSYTNTCSIPVGDAEVIMKGNDGEVSLAVWVSGGYAYSVSSSTSLSGPDMADLVARIL